MSRRDPERDDTIEQAARAYAAARFDDAPPAHVDRAILAHARRRPAARRLLRHRRLAWAAALMLSVAVVVRVAVWQPTPAPDTVSEQSRASAPVEPRREAAPQPQIAPQTQSATTPAPAAETFRFRDDGRPDPARAAAAGCTDSERVTADGWLDCIRNLSAQGDPRLASELAAFRRRHPEHPLPDDWTTTQP